MSCNRVTASQPQQQPQQQLQQQQPISCTFDIFAQSPAVIARAVKALKQMCDKECTEIVLNSKAVKTTIAKLTSGQVIPSCCVIIYVYCPVIFPVIGFSGTFGLEISTVQYSTVQYSTVQYSTVQYSTVQYSTVQYICVHMLTWSQCECITSLAHKSKVLVHFLAPTGDVVKKISQKHR